MDMRLVSLRIYIYQVPSLRTEIRTRTDVVVLIKKIETNLSLCVVTEIM